MIFYLGLARSSVEDFLFLISLHQKNKDIDLREELQMLRQLEQSDVSVLSEDTKYDPREVSYLGHSPTEMPISILKGEDCSEILLFENKDSWVQDGTNIYALVRGQGLVKLSMGVDGGMPGRIVVINKDLDKEGTILLYEGKIYMRSEDFKPAPFKIINCETL